MLIVGITNGTVVCTATRLVPFSGASFMAVLRSSRLFLRIFKASGEAFLRSLGGQCARAGSSAGFVWGGDVDDGGLAFEDGGPAVDDGGPAVDDGGPAFEDGGPAFEDGGPAGGIAFPATEGCFGRGGADTSVREYFLGISDDVVLLVEEVEVSLDESLTDVVTNPSSELYPH